MAASICFRSARESFFFTGIGPSPSGALPFVRFFFAVNNVIHLLVEFVLPLQYGIEVVGLVGALPGPEKGYPDHVADDLFQRLAVLLVHRQQEKRAA